MGQVCWKLSKVVNNGGLKQIREKERKKITRNLISYYSVNVLYYIKAVTSVL